MLPLVYDQEFQQILEERIEFFQADVTVSSLQISLMQILNFLEKIIETELYILEGTSSGGLDAHKLDPLVFHGKVIEMKAVLKEQKEILKFIRVERLYNFLFWNYAALLSQGMQPPIKERDFVYKRCIASLKRLRQLLYSLNYLLTNKKRVQMH